MTPGVVSHRSRRSHASYRSHRSLIRAAAVAAFATNAVAASPARALPSPRVVHREIHDHVHDVLRELVRIPERIHDRHRAHLQVFFGGDAYYAPHRHNHHVYRYPVWVGQQVYYRPYLYCGDRLFTHVDVRPVFWSDWGYASRGSWCDYHHRYYPASHACFHEVRYAPGPYGHRHGRGCGHEIRSDYYGRGDSGGHGGRYDGRYDGRDYDRYDGRVRYRYDDESYRDDDRDYDDHRGKGGKKGKHNNGRHGR